MGGKRETETETDTLNSLLAFTRQCSCLERGGERGEREAGKGEMERERGRESEGIG